MKKLTTRACALGITLLMGGTSTWACSTLPKNINTSRPAQISLLAKTATENTETTTPGAVDIKHKDHKHKDKSKEKPAHGAFKIDNFVVIQTALQKLGVEETELETLIKEGKKLPEILELKNISLKKFKKTLVKEYNKVINQGIKDKQITKTQGKLLKEAIENKVDTWMEANQ